MKDLIIYFFAGVGVGAIARFIWELIREIFDF